MQQQQDWEQREAATAPPEATPGGRRLSGMLGGGGPVRGAAGSPPRVPWDRVGGGPKVPLNRVQRAQARTASRGPDAGCSKGRAWEGRSFQRQLHFFKHPQSGGQAWRNKTVPEKMQDYILFLKCKKKKKVHFNLKCRCSGIIQIQAT